MFGHGASGGYGNLPHASARPAFPTCALLVQHIPPAFTDESLKLFFAQHNAIGVQRLQGNAVVTVYPNPNAAVCAKRVLHGLRILDRVLVANFTLLPQGIAPPQSQSSMQTHTGGAPIALQQARTYVQSGHGSTTVGNAQPQPSLATMSAPRLQRTATCSTPDATTLANISLALTTSPKLYMQVLDLMHQAKLPAPYLQNTVRCAVPRSSSSPPIVSEEAVVRLTEPTTTQQPAPAAKPAAMPYSFQCSTCKRTRTARESSPTSSDDSDPPEVLLEESSAEPSCWALSRSAAMLCTTTTSVDGGCRIRRKRPVIQVNLRPANSAKPALQLAGAPGLVLANAAVAAAAHDVEEGGSTASWEPATEEELRSKIMPLEERMADPKFKKHDKGAPSTVLYLKNLARAVNQDDLLWLFGHAFESYEECKTRLHIRLMQEGRMKGQAFVTFPTAELAQKAMNTVHGVVFKGKPILSQFGRQGGASR